MIGNLSLKSFPKVEAALALMRFDKPIGTWLLMASTWQALWLAAKGIPPLSILVIFTLGVIVMRAAGSVVNDIADRNFDGKVLRTQMRPLAAKTVSVKFALLIFVILLGIATGLLLALPPVCWLIAAIGGLLTVFYPFAKRFFVCPQCVLGITWSFGILMAFGAIVGTITPVGWCLFLANLTLTVAYDTAYAMSDKVDDLQLGIHSTAIWWGEYDRFWIAVFQVITICLWSVIGHLAALSWPYYASIIMAAGLFLYQQKLISERDRDACLQAFLNNRWVGILIWAGIAIGTQ